MSDADPLPSPAARHLILTILGPDRPGLVTRLAGLIAAHGGSWMESRMVHLGGQFAGVVQAQVPGHRAEALRQAIDALPEEGLRATIEEGPAEPTPPPAHLLRLEVVTPDRPGILKEVSAILAAHGLNVEELSTEFVAAPWSGELLFKAAFRVAAGEGFDADALRTAIEDTSAGMMLDLSVSLS